MPKLYLAGEREGVKNGQIPLWLQEGRVKRRLFSYYYHGLKNAGIPTFDMRESAEFGLDLFLDSGAFTAFSKGVEISVEQYAEFVKEYGDMFTVCSSLDAIGSGDESARGSWENFQALQGLDANVWPVWHVREPDSWLEQYIEEGWEFIFIGGMVPETTKWLKERLDGLFYGILTDEEGLPCAKYHGFGLTDQLLMFRYPWYSVDSTSWLMTGVFGSVVFPGDGRLIKVTFSDQSKDLYKKNSWHYRNLPKESRIQVDLWLNKFDVTAEQCETSYKYRDAVNAATFQEMENRIPESFTQLVTQGFF